MIRSLPAVLALSMALAACQSPERQALEDEAMVGTGIEEVCSARDDVDAAVASVAALTPESTVGEAQAAGENLAKALASLEAAKEQLAKTAVAEYRDQVRIFRDAVEEVRQKKDLTLEEAAQQLKDRAAPVTAAREQLAATVDCPAGAPSN
jgi:hypothetical protein